MNKVAQILKNYAGAVLALLAVAVLIMPGALAAQNASPSGQSAGVIASVPLSGPPVRQMLLANQNGKYYLYVDQGSGSGVSVIDVTSPHQPQIVQRNVAWPDRTASGQMQIISPSVAVSQEREGPAREPRPREVNIMDLSNPAHPKVLDTFTNVTSTLPDNARNLIFVANDQGVQIVQHRVSQIGWAVQHECSSESAIQAMPPDCY